MNQNIEVMLETLAKAFPNLSDIESRVDNIKERIFLLQKSMADVPQSGGRGSVKKIEKKDTRSEMALLRSKLLPKTKRQ